MPTTPNTGCRDHAYTWSQGETLEELIERQTEIEERHKVSMERAKTRRKNIPLVEVLATALDDDDDSPPCTISALRHAPLGMTTSHPSADSLVARMLDVKPVYEIPDDNLVGEVLIPALQVSDQVDIAVGFFSSHCIANCSRLGFASRSECAMPPADKS